MRKFLFGATFVVAAAMLAQNTFAGPSCCSKKAKADTVAATSSCSKTKTSCNSPATTVAAKSSCSDSADGFPQIRYMVAGEAYDSQPEAWAALADASEEYMTRFTTVACVVDGKVKYCGDNSCASKGKTASAANCDSKPKTRARKVAMTTVQRSCCGSKKAALAKADDANCSKSKTEQVQLASAKSERTCPLTGKVVTVDANGKSSCCDKPCDKEADIKTVAAESQSGCSKSKTAALVKADDAKSGCCKSKMAKLAKAETKSCSDKAALVKADDAKSGCCKSKLAKLATADTSSCSKTTALVKADDAKPDCCKKSDAKLAKAESATCSKTASLVKADSCSKTQEAKLVKADGCCKSKDARLASATDSCCKDAKNVMYRVAGRNFKTWDEATAAREKAVDAMKGVKMAYVVNGEKVDCSSKVCPKAKEAGMVKFVVNKVETGCELQARVAMAEAQMEAVKLAVNEMVASAN